MGKNSKHWENKCRIKSLRGLIKLWMERQIKPLTISIISRPSHKARKSLKTAIMCQKMFKMALRTVELCKDRLNGPDVLCSCVCESLTLIGWPMGGLLREEMYIFVLSIERCTPAEWLDGSWNAFSTLLQDKRRKYFDLISLTGDKDKTTHQNFISQRNLICGTLNNNADRRWVQCRWGLKIKPFSYITLSRAALRL